MRLVSIAVQVVGPASGNFRDLVFAVEGLKFALDKAKKILPEQLHGSTNAFAVGYWHTVMSLMMVPGML